MPKPRALVFFCLLLALVLGAFVARADDTPRDRHVVLISIDGLRPEFYLSDDYETPTLKALAASGAKAKGVEPVYPSITYPGHATIVTGVRPAKHGIVSNTRFGENGAELAWMWETKDLKARTLWQAAHEKGLKVAITEWPSSVGAEVDWLIPERWALPGESTQALLLKHSTKGLLVEIALALGVEIKPDMTDFTKLDEFISKGAAYVLKAHKPDLMLVHLAQVDHEQHGNGRDSDLVKAAVKREDENIARIRTAAQEAGILDRTIFVIVGDHGFTDVSRTVAPNVVLAHAGLVEVAEGNVKSWKALGHSFGGSMAIHTKDPESTKKAREALEKGALQDGKPLYSIVERSTLDAYGSGPDAAFALEAEDGVGLSQACTGKFVYEEPHVRGTHGGMPTKKQLQTGFIASGPGIRKSTIDKMRLIDIAPTIAKLMGLELPGAEGGVPDILTEEAD